MLRADELCWVMLRRREYDLLDDTFVNCLCVIVAFLSFTAVTQTKQQERGVGSLFDRLFQPTCDPFDLLWIRSRVRGSDYG